MYNLLLKITRLCLQCCIAAHIDSTIFSFSVQGVAPKNWNKNRAHLALIFSTC